MTGPSKNKESASESQDRDRNETNLERVDSPLSDVVSIGLRRDGSSRAKARNLNSRLRISNETESSSLILAALLARAQTVQVKLTTRDVTAVGERVVQQAVKEPRGKLFLELLSIESERYRFPVRWTEL